MSEKRIKDTSEIIKDLDRSIDKANELSQDFSEFKIIIPAQYLLNPEVYQEAEKFHKVIMRFREEMFEVARALNNPDTIISLNEDEEE